MTTGRGVRPKATAIFDLMWRFAAERQTIFYKRLAGEPLPWTTDPILAHYKFTNAYRASDRTSQFLIREVLYRGSQDPQEVFFRALLFRLFNRADIWELLEDQFGEIASESFRPGSYAETLDRARLAGRSLYSAAYIIPPVSGNEPKHEGHLKLVEAVMQSDLPRTLADAPTLNELCQTLRTIRSFGPFLSYQLAIDLNYSAAWSFSEMDYVLPGPGALEGIRKCFEDRMGWSDADLIRYTTEIQHDEFERLDVRFQTLWGRPLQLIDCQNLFCEIGKYSRVSNPESTPQGGRTKIKQSLLPAQSTRLPWYPPKWGLNDQIERTMGGDHHGSRDPKVMSIQVRNEPDTASLYDSSPHPEGHENRALPVSRGE